MGRPATSPLPGCPFTVIETLGMDISLFLACAERDVRSSCFSPGAPADRSAGAFFSPRSSLLRCRGAVKGCDKTRSEEHTSELQSLMRISYAVFCLKKKKMTNITKDILLTKPYLQYYTSM